MNGPKQKTAKTVLNAITFKELPGKNIGIPEPISIDITDLLKEHNADSAPNLIFGITSWDGSVGEYGEAPAITRFVIDEVEIEQMVAEICNVIDAAIVNSNQAKAIKHLISNIEHSFVSTHWDKIRG